MNRLFNLAFGAVIQHFVKQKIREGSIKAVKAYITVIKGVRLGAMGVAALCGVVSILVTGLVLMIVGLVGLFPIEPESYPIVFLIVGAIFAILGGVVLGLAFSQKRWLQLSKSYELMDAVLAPWPGVLPPNPADVVKRGVPNAPDDYSLAAREMAVTGDVRTSKHTPVERAEYEHDKSFGRRRLEPQLLR